jgi:DNA-binding LacI/PurR family transcriptional regulator
LFVALFRYRQEFAVVESVVGRAQMGPTIIDVAKRAGVSKSLVSLVMRNSPNVSEARRTAVLKAAEDLGYRPNALARGLVQGRTYTIGVLLSDLHNPFFAEIVDGIEETISLSQHRALLGTGNRDPHREARTVEAMLERQMDGVILVSPAVSKGEINAVAQNTPLVLVGRRVRDQALDCVVNDDFAGAVLAVEHLAELGHRRIAHISGGSGAGARARLRGYRHAMQRLDLERHAQVTSGTYTDRGGYHGALRLLGTEPPPTALFASNDFAALGALTAISEAGLSVPEDISLVGYDNTYLATLSSISLSSVNQPRREMGTIATRLLLERIEAKRAESRLEVLMPTLIARSTSAPPR